MAQRLELRQSDPSSHPNPSPPPTQGTQKSWEASEDLDAPRQLRGGALRWKPTGLELRCGGASPLKPSPPPARLPNARSPGQEARGPWPDSLTGGGEVSGVTHQREKLLGNSGWPPGSVTLRVSRPRASRALSSSSGPRSPYPQDPLTWTKLGGSWG